MKQKYEVIPVDGPIVPARIVNEFDICLFCLDELRRGIPENGICGHEELNAKLKQRGISAQRGNK